MKAAPESRYEIDLAHNLPVNNAGDYDRCATLAGKAEQRRPEAQDGHIVAQSIVKSRCLSPAVAGQSETDVGSRSPVTIDRLRTLPRNAAHWAIRFYQVTISSLVGRQCRHLPTCSSYADEAIGRHGLWAGGWMGLARICRCHPWGSEGFDPVPEAMAPDARWFAPWRYGRWGRQRDEAVKRS